MSPVAKNIGLFLLCTLVSVALLSPQSRLNLKALVQPPERSVLATLPFQTESAKFHIVKIRKGEDIAVEIYRASAGNGNNVLHSVFEIPAARDVFYDFKSKTKSSLSNLFEANIDDEPDNEIIVPVMDQNLVSKFNVIKFDPKAENFTHFVY